MNLCVYVRLFAHVQMKRRVQWMCVRMMSVCACFIHMRDSRRRRRHHRCHRSRSTLCYGPKCEWISQKQNKSVNYFKRILIIFCEIFELWIVNGFGYNGAVYASWMWILCVCFAVRSHRHTCKNNSQHQNENKKVSNNSSSTKTTGKWIKINDKWVFESNCIAETSQIWEANGKRQQNNIKKNVWYMLTFWPRNASFFPLRIHSHADSVVSHSFFRFWLSLVWFLICFFFPLFYHLNLLVVIA